MKRAAGILMHLSSLDNNYGIGTLGDEAYKFIDFLKLSGQKYWQLLPIGHTSYGDSPYQSFSSFAGNPYFISLDRFPMNMIIDKECYSNINWGSDKSVDYGILYKEVFPILREAYKVGWNSLKDKIGEYYIENSYWLKDYSLFMTLKDKYNGLPWQQWDDEYKYYENITESKISKSMRVEMNFWIFIQYIFYLQWGLLKEYSKQKEIKLIGDIPIYCAEDSVDVWANRKYFSLNKDGEVQKAAGCPPDFFSKDGQYWGNPTYNWDEIKKDNYQWWIMRVWSLLQKFDLIRIDHFRGFESYWEIDANGKDAKAGEWKTGPGKEILRAIENAVGGDGIIAEDLGIITDEVIKLRDQFQIPGMNVLQFAFNPDDFNNKYLLHNHKKNSVVYTGTHDNETLEEWINNKENYKKLKVCMEYLGIDFNDDISWRIIQRAYMSVADLVVIPIQDFIKSGKEGRMNKPGTSTGNWRWRIDESMLTKELAIKINKLVQLYSR